MSMGQVLWTFAEVLEATGGAPGGQEVAQGLPLDAISIDSRTLASGELFIAIKGDQLDGHDYVARAFEAGAAAALVSQEFAQSSNLNDGPLIVVPDTLRAMESLGIAARGRTRAQVVAVTGSVGKTGTKEMMRAAFGHAGAVHAAEKSFNNHWGVPLTLARMPRDTRCGVFEIGMNHPGEIRPLVKMVRPHVAVVTTVEPVHLGYFSSVEQIADAKAEIFEGLESDGCAILNLDNPHFERLAACARRFGARVISFGAVDDAEVRLRAVRLGPDRSEFEVQMARGAVVDVVLGAPGRHLVQNALAVLAASEALGLDPGQAAKALAGVTAPKGRGARTVLQPREGAPILLIDESYNANPASVAAALANLGNVPRSAQPRRVAVLGDMLELGAEGPVLHAALAEPVAEAGVDLALTCGELMRHLHEALPADVRGVHRPTSGELEPDLLAALQPGDAIMVKGSLGSRMGPLVEALLTAYRVTPAG